MRYMSVQIITREMLLLFRDLYKPGQVKIPAEMKQYTVDIGLGKQYFDPEHGEEHAEVRTLSLNIFSEQVLLPMVTGLIKKMPQGLEIVLSPMELPRGVEATFESFDGMALRGLIAWDIETAQEILRFDLRALVPKDKGGGPE